MPVRLKFSLIEGNDEEYWLTELRCAIKSIISPRMVLKGNIQNCLQVSNPTDKPAKIGKNAQLGTAVKVGFPCSAMLPDEKTLQGIVY